MLTQLKTPFMENINISVHAHGQTFDSSIISSSDLQKNQFWGCWGPEALTDVIEASREIPCLPTQVFIYLQNIWRGNQVFSENLCFLWHPGTRQTQCSIHLPAMLTLTLLVLLIHTECPQTLPQTRWNSVCQTQTHCLVCKVDKHVCRFLDRQVHTENQM